jgi:hypothetical protein
MDVRFSCQAHHEALPHPHSRHDAGAPVRRRSSGSPPHGADTATSARSRPDAVRAHSRPVAVLPTVAAPYGKLWHFERGTGLLCASGPGGACRCSRAWLRRLAERPGLAGRISPGRRTQPAPRARRPPTKAGYGGRPGGGTDRGSCRARRRSTSRADEARGGKMPRPSPSVATTPTRWSGQHRRRCSSPSRTDHWRRRTPDGSPPRIHRQHRSAVSRSVCPARPPGRRPSSTAAEYA